MKEVKGVKYARKLNPDYKPYCNSKCQAAAKNSRQIVKCTNCGKEVEKRQADLKKNNNTSFCSKTCSATYNNKKRAEQGFISKDKTKTATCKVCGKEIIIPINSGSYLCPEHMKKRNYARISQNKKRERSNILLCIVCAKEIIGNKGKKYCDDCRPQYFRNGGLASASKMNRRSKNEIYFATLCEKEFATQTKITTNDPIFDSPKGKWDADVILHEFKIAVLWNGIWHYEKINDTHKLLQVQTRDKIKLDVIVKNGFTPYIVKDMGKFNRTFVEEQFEIFKQYIISLIK